MSDLIVRPGRGLLSPMILRPAGPPRGPYHVVAAGIGGAQAVAWSDDGRVFAVVDEAGQIILRDAAGALLARVLHPSATCVALSADGALALSGGYDRKVLLTDLRAGGSRIVAEHRNWVSSVALSSDGALALSGGDDRKVLLTDLRTGGGRELPALAPFGPPDDLAFIGDGTRLMASYGWGAVFATLPGSGQADATILAFLHLSGGRAVWTTPSSPGSPGYFFAPTPADAEAFVGVVMLEGASGPPQAVTGEARRDYLAARNRWERVVDPVFAPARAAERLALERSLRIAQERAALPRLPPRLAGPGRT